MDTTKVKGFAWLYLPSKILAASGAVCALDYVGKNWWVVFAGALVCGLGIFGMHYNAGTYARNLARETTRSVVREVLAGHRTES